MQTEAMRLLAFLFVVGLGRAFGEVQDYGRLLQYICDYENLNVEIRTVNDLKQIAALLDGPHGMRCAQHVEDAIKEFVEIVNDPAACSVQKSLAIANFSERYLRESEEFDKLPEPLAEFVIAYGFTMSKRCKANMIESFMPKAKKLLSFDDFKEMSLFADGKSPIARLLDPFTSMGDFVLPVDLSQAIPDFDKKNFFVQVKKSGKLSRAKELCKQRYQPLYEDALLPIAYLARAGFDDRRFRMILYIEPWLRSSGHFWTRIVFLCEYFKHDEDTTEDTDNYSASEHVDRDADNEYKYTPKKRVGEEILREGDSKLKSQIKLFDANEEPEERLQEKILRNSFGLLIDQLRYGKFMPFFKNLFKSKMCKLSNNCDSEESEQMVDEQLKDIMDSESYPKFYRKLREKGKWLVIAPLVTYACVLFPLTAFVGWLNDPKLEGGDNPTDAYMANIDIRKEIF